MPAGGLFRRPTGRLEEALLLPQPDRVGAEEASGNLSHPRIGGQRSDVVIGPPGVVDVAEVVLAWFEGQTERRRLSAAVVSGDDPSGRLEETGHLVGVEESRRHPVPVAGVTADGCLEVEVELHLAMSSNSTSFYGQESE